MNEEIEILQYLAMQGIAQTDEIEQDSGLDGVQSDLESMEEQGYVERDGFWYITDSGEDYLAELCRNRFTDEQVRELESIFDDFEEFDSEFKELSNRWQQTEDEDEQAELIRELDELHAEVEGLFDELSADAKAVYERYIGQLRSALNQLKRDNYGYFTGTEVDSYHNIWFELHDDLLRTLRKGRNT